MAGPKSSLKTYLFIRSGGTIVDERRLRDDAAASAHAKKLADKALRAGRRVQVAAERDGMTVSRVWSGDEPVYLKQ